MANLITAHYAPPACIEGETVILPEEEAHHVVRVLRRRVGDEITVVDGEGGWYRVRLDEANRTRAAGTILERRQGVGEPPYDLTIGMAVLKNPGRFETFLEKAAELGVSAVVPLHTGRTEKERIKPARARRILVAAMKQCGRSRLVRLDPPQALPDLLRGASPDLGFLCHEQADPACTLDAMLRRYAGARRVVVLVGPEGGFTEDEVAGAREAGYHPVSLGPRRLRAETAGLVAAAAVMLARPHGFV
ncbi:MAG: ribosomal RNA small subunit methyltransferase E [Rhodothermaceae bacterium]|nr:MAG: ribosomal RNA small subunit methyltransferase E [Rhodothermaceae bacterium]